MEVLKGEETINLRKLEAAGEILGMLRQQLGTWQSFLEEKHLNWREAFDAGISLETASAEAVYSIKGGTKESRAAAEQLEAAVTQIGNLICWKNRHGVPIDPEASYRHLDTPTSRIDAESTLLRKSEALQLQQSSSRMSWNTARKDGRALVYASLAGHRGWS